MSLECVNPKICLKCGGEVSFSLSEVHLISLEETGFEGICEKCYAHVYLRYKLDKIELTEFDEFMNEVDKKEIKI